MVIKSGLSFLCSNLARMEQTFPASSGIKKLKVQICCWFRERLGFVCCSCSTSIVEKRGQKWLLLFHRTYALCTGSILYIAPRAPMPSAAELLMMMISTRGLGWFILVSAIPVVR